MKRRISLLLAFVLTLSVLFASCSFFKPDEGSPPSVSLDSIPEFDGSTPYVTINDNIPFFDGEDTSHSYEKYSELDSLGRCGVALACLGTDLMPTEDRESISHVKPSGWHSVQYDVVPGGDLYNRCHLIGFQLAGENDNEKNLITGTRNMNNEGMLDFENDIAAYLKKNPENHVLYRVTPMFEGNDLVARGVLMEAKSVEDDGLVFCIYVYNAQPGVVIDYKTGESRLADDPHAELLGDGHDEVDILPDAAPDTVTHIYAEYDEDTLVGAVVVTSVRFGTKTLSVAADIDEEGRVDFVKIISGYSEVEISAWLSFFVDKDYSTVGTVVALAGMEDISAAVKGAVTDALMAYAAYVDAVENGSEFIINISSDKFHLPECKGAQDMLDKNKLYYVGYCEDLVSMGYSPCGTCKPCE